MVRIGVWGLGSMGLGMARSLVRAGHRVCGHDPRGVSLDGGCDLPDGDLDAAVIVVLNAAQTDDVIAGLVGTMKPGAVVIACATVPPEFARAMEARCADAGLHYLDAPISGGAARAAAGDLAIMASGSPEAFAAAEAILAATATSVFRMGDDAGAGSAMKAVNQTLAGIHIAAMAEAMVFGITQGIDPERFMDVIPQCAGTSWMLENRGAHVRDADYAPRSSVDIWPKDLGIVAGIANGAGIDMPLAQAALSRFAAASGAGLGGEDDAAVAKVYAAQAGVDLPGGTS